MELREIIDGAVERVVSKAGLETKRPITPVDVVVTIQVIGVTDKDEQLVTNPEAVSVIRGYKTAGEKTVKIVS